MTTNVLILGGSGFIGTNLIEELELDGLKAKIFDINPPLNQSHNHLWIQGDILDYTALFNVVQNESPSCIIDLVARTDVDETVTVEKGYALNYKGVQNIIEVIATTECVSNVVFTSTQYVKEPGHEYENVMSYSPHTVYGASKVQMEELILDSKLSCQWTIIRPTNVWGPWHYRYKNEFFKVLKKGLYFHPGGEDAIKSYAYVGNVASQISKILQNTDGKVNKKILYVGDEPISILKWVNLFSKAFTGKGVIVIPRIFFLLVAKMGDMIGRIIGRPFLINSSRLNSMTEHYQTPMDLTFSILGESKYSIEDGVQKTVEWIEGIN
jgi:GlcNAc-P-P-Und epimerase